MMREGFDHMDELIGKYLAGEATLSEKEDVESWMNVSVENQKHFDQLKMIFERSSAIKGWQRFDEDQAWKKLRSKIEEKKIQNIPVERSLNLKLFYRIAASIIILFGVGFYFYESSRPGPIVKVMAVNKTVSDTLPDGSDVFLNKQTTLTYHYDRKKKRRMVRLNGEAYFHIRHDEKKEFFIDAAGVYIRDIGTSFDVKAYPDSHTVEVVVKEGEVEFFSEDNSGLHLKAPSKGVFDKLTKKFSVGQPESNALSFKTMLFTFSNQDLGTVVEELNRVYEKKLVISNNLRRCFLTVAFDNENIDEIADVIAETLGLSVKRSGNEIILEGAGCEN